jgi:hypothetical protein
MSEFRILNVFGSDHPNFPNSVLVHVDGGERDGDEYVEPIKDLLARKRSDEPPVRIRDIDKNAAFILFYNGFIQGIDYSGRDFYPIDVARERFEKSREELIAIEESERGRRNEREKSE